MLEERAELEVREMGAAQGRQIRVVTPPGLES
jgi:hypothetical protein